MTILFTIIAVAALVALFARQRGGTFKGQAKAPSHRLVTPEGLAIDVEIAPATARLFALVIDLTMIAMMLVALAIGLTQLFDFADLDYILIGYLLAFFALRYFWFIGFESSPRAATPGKRALGLRVVARDGGTLDFGAVVARNLIRDLEWSLPLLILFEPAMSDVGGVDSVRWLAALAMSALLSAALLFNRDRMRIGDIVAGTWVVVDQRRRLARNLIDEQSARDAMSFAFSPAELATYGVYELQVLEQVLRRGQRNEQRETADAIRHRLGRELIGDDRIFLEAYYHAARAHMERELLFGQSRRDKHDRIATQSGAAR